MDPANPMRSEVDRDAVFELSESIKKHGLINPITVRPFCRQVTLDGSTHNYEKVCVRDKHIIAYEVVAGHRRFMACKLAGLNELPCVVRELSDDESWSVMAHENLERQDIDPVDEALFLGRIIGEDELKIKEVSESLNRSPQWVASRLEILSYPDYFLLPIKKGEVRLGVARILAKIEDDYWRKHFFESSIRNGMSIPQAEYAFAQWNMGILASPVDVDLDGAPQATYTPKPASAICSACRREAVEPNMQLVWVHLECPDEKEDA